MTPMDCTYNVREICKTPNIYPKERDCKNCEIYKYETSLIQCPCGFIDIQDKWFETQLNKNISIISCPECGTIKNLTPKTHQWRKQNDNILFR